MKQALTGREEPLIQSLLRFIFIHHPFLEIVLKALMWVRNHARHCQTLNCDETKKSMPTHLKPGV